MEELASWAACAARAARARGRRLCDERLRCGFARRSLQLRSCSTPLRQWRSRARAATAQAKGGYGRWAQLVCRLRARTGCSGQAGRAAGDNPASVEAESATLLSPPPPALLPLPPSSSAQLPASPPAAPSCAAPLLVVAAAPAAARTTAVEEADVAAKAAAPKMPELAVAGDDETAPAALVECRGPLYGCSLCGIRSMSSASQVREGHRLLWPRHVIGEEHSAVGRRSRQAVSIAGSSCTIVTGCK